MCTSCGNSSCGGSCKKSCIKVYKPTRFIGGQTGIPGPEGDDGVSIVNIVDNGDGTMTITMSDTTTYIIPIPAATVPNDDWVFIEQNGAGISSILWQGSATHNADPLINLAYKVIAPDTAIIQVDAFLDANIASVENSWDFRFALDPIVIGASNWFPLVSKSFRTVNIGSVAQIYSVPVAIQMVYDGETPGVLQPNLAEYQSKGRAFINNGLVICQGIGPAIVAPGRYQMSVYFEIAARLIQV